MLAKLNLHRNYLKIFNSIKMNTNRISVRYAKALFETAQEQKVAERINADMKMLFSLSEAEDFRMLLESPVVAASLKKRIFEQAIGKSVSKLTIDFFGVLTKNKREAFLFDIARNFLTLFREFYRITAVHLTVAQDVEPKFLKEIEAVISERYKTKVEMTHQTDASLIGGFIIRLDDEQFDGSVAHKLSQIEKDLLEN